MRLLFKSVMVAFIVLGIGNYLVYLKTGTLPVMDLRDRWNNDAFMNSTGFVDIKEKYSPNQITAQAKKVVEKMTNNSDASASARVYKWTDVNGQVHYGDQPRDQNAEAVNVDLRNAISPPDAAPPETAKKSESRAETPIEKARAAAEAVNARTREQERF